MRFRRTTVTERSRKNQDDWTSFCSLWETPHFVMLQCLNRMTPASTYTTWDHAQSPLIALRVRRNPAGQGSDINDHRIIQWTIRDAQDPTLTALWAHVVGNTSARLTTGSESTDHHGYESIPQPPEHLYGLLGNLPDIDLSFPAKEIWRLGQMCGPIMKLNLNGPHFYVSNQDLVKEVCDEKKIPQTDWDGLGPQEDRALTGDAGPIGIRKVVERHASHGLFK